MKKLLMIVFTIFLAASVSFAQTGETANKARRGRAASNKSSTREHKGGNNSQKGGQKSNKAGSAARKGWDLSKNTRK